MTLKRTLFNLWIWMLGTFAGILGKKNKYLLLSNMVEFLAPVYPSTTPHGIIVFFISGELPLWRAETLLTKEPETIEWIETFLPSELLWDIGANIGCYSLYAAKKGIRVVSFEPSAVNYSILNKNIELNKLEKNIQAFCMAFNDVSVAGYLNMSSITHGGALNSFGERKDSFILLDESIDVSFRQGMIGFSIDDFMKFYNVPCPNHIKIDVDGNEDKIIYGAMNTLQNPDLKSLLVELDSNNTSYCANVIGCIEQCGFSLQKKKHASQFDSGRGSSIYNYIFTRESHNSLIK